MTYIKEYIDWNTSLYNYTMNVDEVVHPNDWIIYKYVDKTENKTIYTICLDYLGVRSGHGISGLSRYDIISDDDNIIMNVSDDKNICEILTKKYKYKFSKSNECIKIENSLKGYYNAYSIELKELKNIEEFKKQSEEYHLELDQNILNFYMDGIYAWSKIISLKYTGGIFLMLRDKIFTVISNGCGILEVFNLDGSEYKKINTSMEYIQSISISDDNKFLKLSGFIWNPIYLKQYILIDSIFEDKLKSKSYCEEDEKYSDSEVNSELDEDE